MRIIKLLLLALCFFATPVLAEVKFGPKVTVQEMRFCDRDDECIVAEDACPYTWRGVNGHNKAQYEQWLTEVRPLIKCQRGDPLKIAPVQAWCVSNECVIH